MISTIHIDRLSLHGCHGLLSQERVVGAVFYVSLEAEVEVEPKIFLDDDAAGLVSYADIIECIREEMAVPSSLLEHLVYRIGHKLLAVFPQIVSLSLRIDKENPPCGVSAKAIGVSMTISRSTGL